MRLKKRGYRRNVTPGFKSPAAIKGITKKEGLLPIVVSTKKEIAVLDPKQHALVLKSSLGMKKKALLVEEAKKIGFPIINIKDADKFLSSVKENMDKRKKEKESKVKKKEEKLKEKKKKAEEKEKKSIEEKVETEDDKKEHEAKEKKEMDKLLATKQ